MEELRDQLKTMAKIVPKLTPSPVFADTSKRNNDDINDDF
jgi:hypothetical protein